ncbi:hypothetical protein [Roseovarius sp. MMSF_3281]|uniref:hypothetical protein n=1 Tax=Roseovarius sp. MMSF_3281 TaxID=3046694 RepID=UPI00273EC4A6|nr:hypothetical protein [Roseovarius sp. MMSF_3281]
MLITVLCIYLAVYSCALFAARRGKVAVWGCYALSVLGVPPVFGGVFHLVYRRVDPIGAMDISQAVIAIGVALALVAYPLSLWRARKGR